MACPLCYVPGVVVGTTTTAYIRSSSEEVLCAVPLIGGGVMAAIGFQRSHRQLGKNVAAMGAGLMAFSLARYAAALYDGRTRKSHNSSADVEDADLLRQTREQGWTR